MAQDFVTFHLLRPAARAALGSSASVLPGMKRPVQTVMMMVSNWAGLIRFDFRAGVAISTRRAQSSLSSGALTSAESPALCVESPAQILRAGKTIPVQAPWL